MNFTKNILLLLFMFQSLYSEADYPLIQFAVSRRDSLYNQQQQDLQSWYSGNDYSPALSIYKYKKRLGEDLFSLAAAFNLPYDAIVTLNGWDSAGFADDFDYVLIPNIPGIFVPLEPQNNWERIMKNTRENEPAQNIQINRTDGHSLNMLFYAGDKFTKDERILFLSSKFIMPIEKNYITSKFGYRIYMGRRQFHTGVDLRASPGTPVMASRAGTVKQIGRLKAFGMYITIEHEGQYETFYSHLSKILVNQGEKISEGQVIALSGNSGISTGPHLHFEIRHRGIPVNPISLIDR